MNQSTSLISLNNKSTLMIVNYRVAVKRPYTWFAQKGFRWWHSACRAHCPLRVAVSVWEAGLLLVCPCRFHSSFSEGLQPGVSGVADNQKIPLSFRDLLPAITQRYCKCKFATMLIWKPNCQVVVSNILYFVQPQCSIYLRQTCILVAKCLF